MKPTAVSVCVCTYRRAAVGQTLASLARQTLPRDVILQVIVADNDETPQAQRLILEAARTHGLALTYVHAPARNISVARNSCLETATGDWIAFLDDDEVATPDWLGALLQTAAGSQWDAVLGPVRAVYADTAPRWLAAADLHSTAPVFSRGRILKGYAGNVLLKRCAIQSRGLRFDPRLGRVGGEDDDFFYRLTDSGGRIGFAPDAIAYETVPPERSTLSWLAKRSFRTGQTHGARLGARGRGLARWLQLSVAGAKALVCLAAALLQALSLRDRNRWLVRASLHAGVAARLAGAPVLRMY